MRFALLCSVALAAAACAPAQARPAETGAPALAPAARPQEPLVVPRIIVTPEGEIDVAELYSKAAEMLEQGQAAAAAKSFERLTQLDPDGPYAPDAWYQAALAHEQAGDRATSADRFAEVARRHPDHALAREALVRAMRLYCFLERWKRAGELADVFLGRYPDAGPFERVVALSSKALARLEAGDPEGATYYVEKGRNVVDEHRLDAAGAVPRDLAQLYFALGEARRIRAERIRFDPVPASFPAVLEERCQLLLDAQGAYSDTMRAYDAHWSAMAGYRVGELYQKLHQDLMAMPAPKGADNPQRRQLFEGAMRLRYSVLLDKALAMMEHTLSMAKRTGEQSAWVDKAHEAKRALERARDAENAAIDKLPYTRDELRTALEDLAKKAK